MNFEFEISEGDCIFIRKPAIAAMYSPHSVFDIGDCTVVHCDAGGVSMVE